MKLTDLVSLGESSMGSVHAFATRAPRRFRGVVGSWLRNWTPQGWHSRDGVQAEGGEPLSLPPRSIRVLVVDDDPVNLMVMSVRLQSRGLETVMASDGAEAVALASSLSFDLILMDLQMPILDGLGATSAIRRQERTGVRPEVPIVAHSTTRMTDSGMTMYRINDQLGKPCEARALEDCLWRWLPTYQPAAHGAKPHAEDPTPRRHSTSRA
jgi:CheY-like chemotaxis protein